MQSLFKLIQEKALIAILISIILVNYQNADCQFRKSPEQMKRELRQAEVASPLDYVRVIDSEWYINLVSNTIVKGRLKNYATVAGFKNIKLKATFKTKTGSYVSHEIWTVLEFLPPGGTVDFKRTIEGWWKEADLCSVEVLNMESY